MAVLVYWTVGILLVAYALFVTLVWLFLGWPLGLISALIAAFALNTMYDKTFRSRDDQS